MRFAIDSRPSFRDDRLLHSWADIRLANQLGLNETEHGLGRIKVRILLSDFVQKSREVGTRLRYRFAQLHGFPFSLLFPSAPCS